MEAPRPKRKVRGGRKGGNRGRKNPSREVLRAGQVACFFRDCIPPINQEEIKRVKQDLWNRVQDMDMNIIKAEVEEWVTDPGTIVRRLSAYMDGYHPLGNKGTDCPRFDG